MCLWVCIYLEFTIFSLAWARKKMMFPTDLGQEEKTPVVSSTRFDLPPLLRSTVKQSQGRGADPYLSLFLTLAFLGYRLPGGDQF